MAKGSGFLKVTGILSIIGGAICILLGVLGLIALSTAVGVPFLIFLPYMIIAGAGIIELVAGILGIKYSKNIEHSNVCLVFGCVVLALSIISLILTLISMPALTIVSLILQIIFSIAVPVLYLIGAILNKLSRVE